MKTLRFLAIAWALASCFLAYSAQQSPVIDSGVTNGIFVRIQMGPTGTNTTVDPIRYCFLAKSNLLTGVTFPTKDYHCRLTLVDAHGKEVPKTRQGNAFGKRFSELSVFNRDVINTAGRDTGGGVQLDFVPLMQDGCVTRGLPALVELFQVAQPGNYKLMMEFQVFSRNYTKGSPYVRVVFPRVEIPVIVPKRSLE